MGKRKADEVSPDSRNSKKQVMVNHFMLHVLLRSYADMFEATQDAPTPSGTGSGTTPLITQTIDFDNNLNLFTDLPFLSDDQNIMEILNFNIPDLDYSTWGLG